MSMRMASVVYSEITLRPPHAAAQFLVYVLLADELRVKEHNLVHALYSVFAFVHIGTVLKKTHLQMLLCTK